jgi:DNA adenine methylase
LPSPPNSATLQAMQTKSLSYPGGKAGPGVYQRLINEIPPHDVYIAAFAGRDAIARWKKPAEQTILIDADPQPLDWWAKYSPEFELHNCDAIEWLRYRFGLTRYPSGQAAESSDQRSRTFVFIDPPYPMGTRTSGPMYRHEMTDADHARLLEVAKRLPCMAMICSYPSQAYADALRGWRSFKYTSVARSGEKRTEIAWCNYAPPTVLHDARFVGANKREREKVRRRIRRLSSTLAALPTHVRQAVIDAVQS